MKAFIDSLPTVLDAIEGSDAVVEAFVFAAWRQIAGVSTSERTSPIELDGKRLVVAVIDKTWKRNLESLAPQLLFKLNAAVGRPLVDIIDFQIVPEMIGNVRESEVSETEDPVEVPSEILRSASSIGDDRLRHTVVSAAANCLARSK